MKRNKIILIAGGFLMLASSAVMMESCGTKKESENSGNTTQNSESDSASDDVVKTEVEGPAQNSNDGDSSGQPKSESADPSVTAAVNSQSVNGIERLKAAYPQKIKDISNNTITFTDGTTMVYDDGKEKDFVTMLDESDPQDMFFEVYDTSASEPAYLHDVGRSRSEQLFKKLYGNTKEEVAKQLVNVDWMGQKVSFSSSNNAADQLKKVAEELSRHPEYKDYVTSSGSFYWRNVRGAKRLSAHSYGIAIDIAVPNSNYWLWDNKGASETQKISYKNKIPMGIVEIFEKYGFVWGGRWYHYDTMHFEYRPELNPPKK